MSDWIWLGVASAVTFAISEALREPTKPKAKRPTRHAITHLPKRQGDIPTTRTQWPERVQRATREPQSSTVETVDAIRPRKSKRHTGSGPFGMSQREFRAAQKGFKWSVGPDTYDDSVTGWIEGISEDKSTIDHEGITD